MDRDYHELSKIAKEHFFPALTLLSWFGHTVSQKKKSHMFCWLHHYVKINNMQSNWRLTRAFGFHIIRFLNHQITIQMTAYNIVLGLQEELPFCQDFLFSVYPYLSWYIDILEHSGLYASQYSTSTMNEWVCWLYRSSFVKIREFYLILNTQIMHVNFSRYSILPPLSINFSPLVHSVPRPLLNYIPSSLYHSSNRLSLMFYIQPSLQSFYYPAYSFLNLLYH